MRRLIVPAASLLALTVLLPAHAEAQRRGVRVHAGGVHRAAVVRPVRAGYRPVARRSVAVSRTAYYGRGYYGRGYYGRGYYRPAYYRSGVAAGVAAGTLAIGAAAATAPYRYGYGYGYPAGNRCLRQQQVWTGYAYQWQWVRVC